MLNTVRPVRTYLLTLWDVCAWIGGFGAMALLQYAVGYSPFSDVPPALALGSASGVGFFLLGLPVHLHQGRARLASFEDALLTTLMFAIVAALALGANVALGGPARISVSVTGPMAAYVLIMGVRAVIRVVKEWATIREVGALEGREPVVVIGAGEGSAQLITDMHRDADCSWVPVALVDDDPMKRHRRLRGVPVVGRTREFPAVAERHGASTAILAIPSAGNDLVREFNTLANQAGLDLKVVPGINDLSNPIHLQIEDVRDIEVTDFLGRHQIETDVASIANYLTGKRVLVTGAGGSIGSELCRQIHKFGPSELIMLDRDESALHAVQLSIHGQALLDSDDTELCDIRDARYVHDLFKRRQPEVVFHAAALKHLPLLEAAPGQAVKTNVWGSQAVLDAALAVGVERFVNVSTDKAANPGCVLGYTKRLAEGLTSAAARQADGRFMSVRFGNVLGSRGSVLTTFTAQIANGGPVTVTDPRVTRFFMTIAEAVQLVIQAGALGENGDVLVLDMGDPVPIQQVAEQLIELSGRRIDIVYTGLRDGEKMHEELLGEEEPDVRPHHPLISHAHVPAYGPDAAARLDPYAEPTAISRDLARACRQMAAHSHLSSCGPQTAADSVSAATN